MSWYADLHVHSKYSRATSRDCDLEHLASWAQKKGIAVVGSGDLTHPAWRAELREKLVPAEEGLYRLRPNLETEIAASVPIVCRAPVRFLISGEISTIYKKGERTRKVHHIVYVPDLDTADRLATQLARIGNIAADGRPILGLDSRHLLEIVLESGPGAFLVPAHIWTPWFSVLGSRSGFDSIEECYGDLVRHIFALETGLSSDPEMNWRISALDRYRLVSNSDAHSPAKLGREATIFDGPRDYPALRRALETGVGYVGTVEFFPEEGKYHLDGHRKCQVRLTPAETLAHGGRCPVCGEAVVIGVMNRVDALANREKPEPPATAGLVRSLVPLVEILAELAGSGTTSQRVIEHEKRLLEHFGPELGILTELPINELIQAGEPLLAEALGRLRRGEVQREAGYDGEYGVIRLFRPGELGARPGVRQLFAFEAPLAKAASLPSPLPISTVMPDTEGKKVSQSRKKTKATLVSTTADSLTGLDPEQRAAAEVGSGALLIVAGPGSGKTHTLTRRIAYLISHHGVAADACLAVTFTRRAAAELRERLDALLPEVGARVVVHTFHSLGLALLREQPAAAGLKPGFRVIDENERANLLREALNLTATQAERLVRGIGRAKAAGVPLADDPVLVESIIRHDALLRVHGCVDFDDLVGLAVTALETDTALAQAWRARFPWISIDEYQDVDPRQYRLLRLLAPPGSNLCVIGDPNQAIYGFRGADVTIFHRFADDWPGARVVRLARNYRCGRLIVEAASQIIADAAIPAVLADPQRIIHHDAASERAEAEFIVTSIENLLGGHSFFSLDSGRGGSRASDLALSDFAVLARTDTIFESLAEALNRSGLPFQRRSHAPINANPMVSALLDALHLNKVLPDRPLVAQIQDIAEDLARAAEPARAIALRQAAGLLAPLAARYSDDYARLRAELALLTEADTWDPRAERISLLTLHAAKGLEFRVVFILGCEDGLLPLRWGSMESEEEKTVLEEERRLFYVGVTRARERLFLTRAHRRLWRGKIREFAPSLFLSDLDDHLLEYSRTELKRSKKNNINQQLALF
ncbi:DNA helicase II / ATP-dependent DNA helicase PcrA [Gammaproteobacteria bacterium]